MTVGILIIQNWWLLFKMSVWLPHSKYRCWEYLRVSVNPRFIPKHPWISKFLGPPKIIPTKTSSLRGHSDVQGTVKKIKRHPTELGFHLELEWKLLQMPKRCILLVHIHTAPKNWQQKCVKRGLERCAFQPKFFHKTKFSFGWLLEVGKSLIVKFLKKQGVQRRGWWPMCFMVSNLHRKWTLIHGLSTICFPEQSLSMDEILLLCILLFDLGILE